jgi:hypothetical protein
VDPLIIDFADRADIRAKLPAAEGRLADLEAALREQAQEVEDWREYVAVLKRRAELGPANTPSAAEVADAPLPSPSDLPPLDLVVEIVDRENRKIRSRDVAAILRSEGHDMSNMAVSNALFYGAKRADPPRVQAAPGRGFYAPLHYNPFLDEAGGDEPGQGPTDNLPPRGDTKNPDESGGGPNPAQLDAEKTPGEQRIPAHQGHPYGEGSAEAASRF